MFLICLTAATKIVRDASFVIKVYEKLGISELINNNLAVELDLTFTYDEMQDKFGNEAIK
jgi:hypothetical protein